MRATRPHWRAGMERHLGVALTPSSYDEQPWRQEAGPTVFAPFPDTTDYFGARDRVWMVNFRVRDLAAIVPQLRASGIAVEEIGRAHV